MPAPPYCDPIDNLKICNALFPIEGEVVVVSAEWYTVDHVLPCMSISGAVGEIRDECVVGELLAVRLSRVEVIV